MTATTTTRARELYAAECAARPNYPDGTPRKTWDVLPLIAQFFWLAQAQKTLDAPPPGA